MKSKAILKKRIGLVSLFIISSVVFLCAFSWSTSPFFNYLGFDAGIFKSMALFTKEGLMPYKDFFDHKGPIIIFVEFLGYGIINNDFVMLLLQAIFLTASLGGLYKISRFFLDTKKAIVCVFVALGICSFFMAGQGGNTVEEWIFPFIIWSMYFSVKFFMDTKNQEHNPQYTLLYGITLGVAAFSRLTNAMPILVLIAIIAIYLCKNKLWKNLFRNALFFVLGALIITVPILAWSLLTGTFNEMIHATFIFNFKYLYLHGFVEDGFDLFIHIIRYMLPLFASVIVQLYLLLNKKESGISICLLAQSGIAIIMQIISALYAHYLIIWVPTIFITFILCLKHYKEMDKRIRLYFKIYMAVLAIVFVGTNALAIRKYVTYEQPFAKEYKACCKDIANHIPDKNKNIIAYNLNANIYPIADIKPCYKNYFNQDLHTTLDIKTKSQWKKDIHSKKVEYIIVNLKGHYLTKDYLKKHYKLYYKNDKLGILEKR